MVEIPNAVVTMEAIIADSLIHAGTEEYAPVPGRPNSETNLTDLMPAESRPARPAVSIHSTALDQTFMLVGPRSSSVTPRVRRP